MTPAEIQSLIDRSLFADLGYIDEDGHPAIRRVFCAWHRGIGGRLLAHAMETAREQGCSVMNLSIVEENTVLRKWYERSGAVHTHTEKFDFFPFTCGYLKIDL